MAYRQQPRFRAGLLWFCAEKYDILTGASRDHLPRKGKTQHFHFRPKSPKMIQKENETVTNYHALKQTAIRKRKIIRFSSFFGILD